METEVQDKIAEIIPRDSPFFSLYAGNPTLAQVLHIDDIGHIEVPTFRQALNADIAATGLSAEAIGERANRTESSDSGFVSRIINRGTNYDADTRHPIMNSKRLLSLADTAKGDEDLDKFERIPVVFYDSKTGDLILRTTVRSNNDPFEMAQRYLTAEGQHDMNKAQRASYINEILTERAESLNTTTTSLDASFTTHSRSRRIMEIAEKSLGLIPVYLIRTVPDSEFETNGNTLRRHLGLSLSTSRTPS